MDQVTCKPMSILPAGNVKVNIEGQSYSVCKVIDEGREQKGGNLSFTRCLLCSRFHV